MSASTSPEGNPSNHSSAELIQRMIGDMKIRHMSPATIKCYSRHVTKFAQFLAKPLSEATPEDIRLFQLHLIESRKLAWSSFNQAVCSLRFFYRITLPATLGSDHDPVWQETHLSPHGTVPPRSGSPTQMHSQSQTSHLADGALCNRTEDQRSDQLASDAISTASVCC